ncbi:MAG TPA: aminotransferase class IV [Dokdonella sp.]
MPPIVAFAPCTELNGGPATAADLRALALLNYGHFTSMQVRGRAVRGLDLHLDRLAQATRELFGCELDRACVRGWMRGILDRGAGEPGDASMRVTVFARAFDRSRPERAVAPDVLVSVDPPRDPALSAVRVKSFRHQRALPHVKHVGTFDLMHHRRLARLAGCDDAVFVDASGAISEGTIWNVGFLAGDDVVWPDAPALRGVSMQLLERGLGACAVPSRTRRVELAELPSFDGAFFANSACAVAPIARIDETPFRVDEARLARLRACYERNAWQPL